jgi:uncharacterized protein (DUF1697 family)
LLYGIITPAERTISQVNTNIALFRGINVGGKSTLPMLDLVVIFKELGCRNIHTYIQSGNVVFETNSDSREELTKRISDKVAQKIGIKPYILLLDVEELEQAMTRNPFPQAAAIPQSLHLGFLDTTPKKPDLARLERLQNGNEQYQLIGKVFYLFAPDGVGRSKLAAGAEQTLGIPMTDRNWRTVCKIMEMAQKENPS